MDSAPTLTASDDTCHCAVCNSAYSPELAESCPQYFEHPYRYSEGVHRVCLACWLGVGPLDEHIVGGAMI